MVIGLTGASGFLGQEIIHQAVSQGDQVVAYSRTPEKPVSEAIRTEAFGPGMQVSNLDAILHLAGESILGPWTKARRDRILQSRVQGTRWIVEALHNAPNPPRTLVCASGVNIYGDRGEEELVEESPVGSSGFLCSVAVAWESEANRAANSGVRVVTIRIAMVLGRKGALPLMLPAFWLGLGGRLGSGNQWMPWIHVEDVANLFLHAAHEESIAGPLNGVSPFPLRNRDFTRILGNTLRRPTFLAVPRFVLKAVLREQASLLLESEHALPKRALETGFRFRFPYLEDTLHDILKSR
ncbi:MAG TPA: TIGR01777 family oxidoreductase [Chthoniobacterales bacterium]|jgi:hypothetical protein|nr:TIGR01777 family oxidoreductase [Chthoniobacterales bacterium]